MAVERRGRTADVDDVVDVDDVIDLRAERGTAPTTAVPAVPELADRILDATLRCVARWGMAKTTLDDVAREAGCARASIYRAFPGGKPSVLHAAGEREISRFLDGLSARIAAVGSLRELLAV